MNYIKNVNAMTLNQLLGYNVIDMLCEIEKKPDRLYSL